MTEPPRCRGCKRRLKHATASGYGPVCERRINGRPVVVPSPAHTEIHPDQTELPLFWQPVTLWSL